MKRILERKPGEFFKMVDTEELINADLQHLEDLDGSFVLADDRSEQKIEGVESIEREKAKMEEEFKEKLLNLDTLTMMAKYQIMFIKFEDKIKRIIQIESKKRKDHKMEFFARLSANLAKTRLNTGQKIESTYFRLNRLIKLISSQLVFSMSASFTTLQRNHWICKQVEKEDKKLVVLATGLKSTEEKRKALSRGQKSPYSSKTQSRQEPADSAKKTKEKFYKNIIRLATKLDKQQKENKRIEEEAINFESESIKFIQKISKQLSKAMKAIN
jgi:hypothetical protein